MVRVQTPQITVPIGAPPRRANVAAGLAQIGRVLGEMQERDRATSERATVLTMQTDWLGTIDQIEADLQSVAPDERQAVFAKGLEPIEQKIGAIEDPALQQELQIQFDRDAMRGDIRVRRDARKARGELLNAASIRFEGQLIVELNKGVGIDEVVARHASQIDAMVGKGAMHPDTAEARKRTFRGRAVREQFGGILDSDLPADVKAEAGHTLLDSDIAVSSMEPGERTAKKQTLDGLVPHAIHELRHQATAAGETGNLLMLDRVETQLLSFPKSALRTRALEEVKGERAKVVASFDVAEGLVEFYAADEPAPRGRYSVKTRNETYRLLQDDARASMEEIGEWFARSPGVDFPPDFARDVRNLFDHGSGDFDLAKGISVYQAIAAEDRNAANRMIADSNIKDVSQTVVRMTEMLAAETDRIIDVMSRGEANVDAQEAANLLTDDDSKVNAETVVSNTFDPGVFATADVMLHDAARRDWKAATLFRFIEAKGPLADGRAPSEIIMDAAKRGANDLRERYNSIEVPSLPGFYDSILVPKWVDVTEELQSALVDFSLDRASVGFAPPGDFNGGLVMRDESAFFQLFPAVADGRVTGVLVWDGAQQTGNVVLPTDSGFNKLRDQIVDRSDPSQRDAFHWMTWSDSFSSQYIMNHDPNLARRLFAQVRAEVMSIGVLPDDVAEQKALILFQAEAIAQAKGWKGIVSETP